MRLVVCSIALCFSASAYAISWEDKDLATAEIASCVGVYAHIAHHYQIADRPGAAANYISRAATAITTNMFFNRDGDSVSGERLHLMRSAQDHARGVYEGDLQQAAFLAADCDEASPDMVRRMSGEPPLFGKSFLDFRTYMFEQMKGAIGL
ncbi:hypothetical protein [Halomonas sp. KO116]|uniref:hypothetical protein n=1 Tax=Halomonas sp. KO116 TaxID=1504981 RepID=UPI0004E411C4|nr:hypothetical protein [Halomonas sp. KO116]AJY51532.1 hypothetical protein KO116_03059 [Halomonas sp. KO116]